MDNIGDYDMIVSEGERIKNMKYTMIGNVKEMKHEVYNDNITNVQDKKHEIYHDK